MQTEQAGTASARAGSSGWPADLRRRTHIVDNDVEGVTVKSLQ